MAIGQRDGRALREELTALRARLADYEELMRAIRAGEVDALFLCQGDDARTLTLGDAGATFRALVEAMSEGAAIVQRDGTLLYCNRQMAAILGKPLESVMGVSLLRFVAPKERAAAARLLVAGHAGPGSGELSMRRPAGGFTPVQWSVSPLDLAGQRGVCVVATDLSEHHRVQEALRSLSLVDELTGLFNRRGFIMHAEQQLKLARRIDGQLLLVFADLDGLKPINDQLGHKAGDTAIRDAADVLRRCFRESDILARLGGDEFAVLATGTDGHAVEVLRQRLHRHIDEHNRSGERPFELSLSVGIIPYDPSEPAPVIELLMRADAAMYENKRGKRRADREAMCPDVPVHAATVGVPQGTPGFSAVPPVGVWEWTREADRVIWSPEVRELLGVAALDGTLQSLVAMLHEDDRKRVIAEARSAFARRVGLVSQFRVVTASGRMRVLASRTHGEYDADGRVSRLLGTLTDIGAASAGSELAQAALDTMDANICVLDGESRIVAVNRGWCDFGLARGAADPASHIGVRYLDVCAADTGPHADLSRQFVAGLERLLAGGETHFELEYPCHGPTEQRWFKVSAIRCEVAGEMRVVVRHQDITDAIVVEDCLSETLHPSDNHVQHARDGIFILQDERIVFVNRACAELLSTAPDRLVGLRFVELLTPGQASLWRQRLEPGAIPAQRRREGRVLLKKHDDVALAALMTVTPTLYNGQPALLGTLHCSASDAEYASASTPASRG